MTDANPSPPPCKDCGGELRTMADVSLGRCSPCEAGRRDTVKRRDLERELAKEALVAAAFEWYDDEDWDHPKSAGLSDAVNNLRRIDR